MGCFDESFADAARWYLRRNLLWMILSGIALVGLLAVLRYGQVRDDERAAYYASVQAQQGFAQWTNQSATAAPPEQTSLPPQTTVPATTATEPSVPEAALPETTLPQNLSFYGKLQRSEEVHILVLGDGIALGTGLQQSSDRWPDLLAARLTEDYGSKVTCTNAAVEQAGSYGTYVCAMTQELDRADLVILCVGGWDSKASLAVRYEALLQGIHQRYPGCAILAVVEHPLADNPAKAKTIRELCAYYDIPIADLTLSFPKNGGNLVQKDDSYPNGEGHRLYADTLAQLIRSLHDADIPLCPQEPMKQAALELTHFEYIGADRFTRTDNTFRLDLAASGILGIDYHSLTGQGSVRILADGKLVGTKKSSSSDAEPLRTISIVDEFQTREYLEVVFSRTEEADGFGGIVLHRG